MQDTEGSRGSKEIKDKVHSVANFATFPQKQSGARLNQNMYWLKLCSWEIKYCDLKMGAILVWKHAYAFGPNCTLLSSLIVPS